MAMLAIDFGGTRIKAGLVDGGAVLESTELVPSGSAADLDAVRAAAADLAEGELGREAPLDGVGIALPGVVTSGRLLAAHDKYAWAHGLDLRAWAADVFAAHTVVENDARAALVGETVYGSAAGARDAVLVTLGTGIGTAALMDGRLVRGRHGHAGILGGHVTVQLDGPACNCGNTGCAEAVASTWALARDAAADPALGAALGGTDAGLKALFDRAGDPVIATVLQRYLPAWGAAVVGMCHAYDPEIVVLSGGVLRAADAIVPSIRDYVASHLWSSSTRPDFAVPTAPEHSVLRGLSALATGARSGTPARSATASGKEPA